jgi:coatomer subunit beta
MLTLILINRTKKTLQNVLVEMFIKEGIKLAEKPGPFNMAPQQIKTLRLMFRANETEDGFLFGYVSYASPSGNVPNVVPLDHIPLNFLDAVVPEAVPEKTFKQLWAELVWENKFSFSVKQASPYDFLLFLSKKINLAIVSSLTQFDQSSDLLVANLFGKSKFGSSLCQA